MRRDPTSRMILRAVALVAIVAGVLSLLGVRPMNSRTIEVVLGTAALFTGVALLAMTFRGRQAGGSASVA